jgi:hypothetical protein
MDGRIGIDVGIVLGRRRSRRKEDRMIPRNQRFDIEEVDLLLVAVR